MPSRKLNMQSWKVRNSLCLLCFSFVVWNFSCPIACESSGMLARAKSFPSAKACSWFVQNAAAHEKSNTRSHESVASSELEALTTAFQRHWVRHFHSSEGRRCRPCVELQTNWHKYALQMLSDGSQLMWWRVCSFALVSWVQLGHQRKAQADLNCMTSKTFQVYMMHLPLNLLDFVSFPGRSRSSRTERAKGTLRTSFSGHRGQHSV